MIVIGNGWDCQISHILYYKNILIYNILLAEIFFLRVLVNVNGKWGQPAKPADGEKNLYLLIQ